MDRSAERQPSWSTQPPGPIAGSTLDSVSSGFNVVTDGWCDLGRAQRHSRGRRSSARAVGRERRVRRDTDAVGREPAPRYGTPIPRCAFVPFGEGLEGEQHLAEFGLDVFTAVTSINGACRRQRAFVVMSAP